MEKTKKNVSVKKVKPGKRIACGISMTPEEQKRIKLAARLDKKSFSAWIMDLVRAKLEDDSVKLISDKPAANIVKSDCGLVEIKTEEKKMKKIINGKKYDTETAECIGEWDNGLGVGDFNQCSESLYKKKTGEFFLYGSGGARSKYADLYEGGRSMGSGEDIVPLSEEDARQWAEQCLSAEEYESIFGEVEE